MPAVNTSSFILITGGAGFVGSAVIENLLSKGFSVRAAIRSGSKAALLKSTFSDYVESGKLTFAIVPNFVKPNAFDAAVKDVDAIVHCASPMPPATADIQPDELIQPAVQGTIGLLESAVKNGHKVQRVVVTSSVVTLLQPQQGRYIYTESDWFDLAPELVSQNGVKTPGPLKYVASKVLAERAARNWVEKNKPTFDLVTVLPPWIWGKSVVNDISHFRDQASNGRLLNAIIRGASGQLENYLEVTEFTHVQDVAEGHLKALITPGASGQRLALRGGLVTFQDAFDILNEDPIEGVSVPKGNPGSAKNFVPTTVFSGDKAAKILGMTYRAVDSTVRETVSQAVELGWKQ
ncbi:NAD(P)-binding protein [Serendipita vermifera]|nr:NAD(P)-binding protein [Serendipita vermifera]